MSCVRCSVATVLRRFWSRAKTYTDRQETVEAHCSMLGETTLGPATALVDHCLADQEAAVVLLQHFLARRRVAFASPSTFFFFPLMIRGTTTPCPSVHPWLHPFCKAVRNTHTWPWLIPSPPPPRLPPPLMSAFVSCTASRQHYSTAVKAEGWRSSWPQSAGMTSGQTSAGRNLFVPPLPLPPVMLPKQWGARQFPNLQASLLVSCGCLAGSTLKLSS